MCSQFVKHWGKWDPKIFRNNFNKKNIKIITYKTKRVAFYDVEFKEGFSYINNLQLSTQVQKKGLGSVLIDLIERETKKHKLKTIRLKVFKDNLARKFYIKKGFKQIKEEKSALILEKKV